MAIIKTAVDATIAVTAVDTFIYDTRKDSDGGAWRKRTQNTSWYNEELNTATRGSRKEFPTVAVIVAETDKVTIYDGDDAAMPMWMVFNQAGWNVTLIIGADNTSTSMINGKLAVGTAPNAQGLVLIDFILDRSQAHLTASNYGGVDRTSLALRNAPGHTFSAGTALGDPTGNIASNAVNDVAMTVLPNAPIDPATGLPVPTIAVATNGGVSVIKDNGTVVDISQTTNYTLTYEVAFTKDNKVAYIMDSVNSSRVMRVDSIPASDFVVTSNQLVQGSGEEFYGMSDFGSGLNLFLSKDNNSYIRDIVVSNDNNRIIGCDNNIAIVAPNLANPSKGSVAYITPDYNTGWMHGDIKLATLSDTDTTNVVGTELVTNGTFDSNVSGWATSSNGTITWDSGNGGRALVTSTSGGGERAYQVITTVVGQTYTASVYTDSNSNNATPLLYKNGALKVQPPGNYVGWMTHTFVATSTSTTIGIGWNSSVSGYYDNISVRLAEEDRSVNGNGLQVFGTVTKTPVATGADLVGYSGWSEDNYLYNSSIPAFSTGDYFVSTWFKPESNGASYSHLVSIDGQSDSTGVTLKIHHTNGNSVYFYGNATTLVSSAQSLSNGQWYCISGGRVNGVWKLYLNGSLLETGSNNAFGVGGSSTCSLMVGHNPTVGAEFTQGQQALLRVSATFPSDDQIKKMYEDEKTLFQAGTQATLYGTSDAVTALAYDDDTELLHAGTSSGRSVFQGLRRVDNTTTAVGVSISASNSMVLED